MNMPRLGKRTKGKERITVSLSRESAEFLRTIRAELQSPSMSALFEKIVGDLQGKTEMEQLDAKIRAYYDTVPEAAIKEESNWGELGEAALALEREDAAQPEMAVVER
jgi:hypothetical protein